MKMNSKANIYLLLILSNEWACMCLDYLYVHFQNEPIKSSLQSLFKLIEITVHTPEWLLQEKKSKRYVDNRRPLTVDELAFLKTMTENEIILIRGNYHINRHTIIEKNMNMFILAVDTKDISRHQTCQLSAMERIQSSQHVTLSLSYDELPSFLLSAIYDNYHVTWFDVATIDRKHYFTFIWNKKQRVENRASILFYNLNPAQFHELTMKMNCRQFNLVHYDVYRHANEKMLRYICLYARQHVLATFQQLSTAVIEHRWHTDKHVNAIHIRPHVLCEHLYYTYVISSASANSRFFRLNMNDEDLLDEHRKALTDNYKLMDLKVYHTPSGDHRFIAMWTNEQEGASTLFLGLSYDELIERLHDKQLHTAIITNYGLLVDGQQCFALVCNQQESVE
jgi:hypothetical protein